jgi:hypothetical protein
LPNSKNKKGGRATIKGEVAYIIKEIAQSMLTAYNSRALENLLSIIYANVNYIPIFTQVTPWDTW